MDTLKFTDLKQVPTPNDIKRAKDFERVGNYFVAKDLTYTHLSDGQYTAPAVHSAGDKAVVIKLMRKRKFEKQKTRNHIPGDHLNVESHLQSKNFSNSHVMMPLEQISVGENLARIFDVGSTDLESYLEKYPKLDTKTALSIAIRVGDGLYDLHRQGVVHTDVAPLNIILFPNDVRLTDLDAASVEYQPGKHKKERSDWDRWGNRFGLPPEMFTDAPEYTANVDIYQTAAMLYRMLAGDWPYDAEAQTREMTYEVRMETYRKLHAKGDMKFPESITPELQAVIKKAMDPHPGRRYESMRQFVVDLIAAYSALDKNDFLRRIKKKNLAEIVDSIAHREKVFHTARGKGAETLTWELEQLKAEYRLKKEQEKTGVSLFTQRELTTRSVHSTTLEKDAHAQLNAQHEVKSYFERQDPAYLAQLKALASQIKEPMEKTTRAAVCIPVAGAQESSNIYKTLKSYAEQKADFHTFEIVLLINIPERFVASKAEALQKTLSEIIRAKRDFPHLNVRNANVVLPDDQVRIGNIRKIGTDLALMRQQETGVNQDLLLLSNDADNQGISESYIKSYLEYFAEHPDKDGAVGNLQFDPQAFIRFPVVQVKQEFATNLDQTGFKNGNVNLFGSNSVMKTSIYSAIGGYPTSLKTGEQEWTGATIRKLRKHKGTLGFVEKAVLTTSSRRAVTSYLQGKRVTFGDEKAEERMRSMNIEDFPLFDFENSEHVERFKTEITEIINRIVSSYEQGERLGKNSWYYRKNLEKIGIHMKVLGDPHNPESKIVITDIGKFIKRQEVMQRAIKRSESNMAKVIEASLEV